MDWDEKQGISIAIIKKYKWILAVLVAGIFLMMLPQDKIEHSEGVVLPEKNHSEVSFEEKLETILSSLDGAGTVKVLLSTEYGANTHYQTDTELSKREEEQDKRSETVIITASDRNEMGLIQRIDAPIYRGAVILCQGADSPAVKLAVVDAVSTATGLKSDRISVLKMK